LKYEVSTIPAPYLFLQAESAPVNPRFNRLVFSSVIAVTVLSCNLAFGQYAGLVINEILPSPTNASGAYVDANQDGAYSSIDDEFIELLNTSATEIDVAGMWITDANTPGHRHVFNSRILPPGGSIVVFGGGSLLNFSNPPAQIATGGGLRLNNDTETLSLFSPQTTVVDQVSYQLTASHNAISIVRNPDGTGGFTNHYLATTNALRASPGRRTHGLPFLTNQPPILMDLPDQTAFVGLELQFPVRAFDPADRDAITLSVLDNPANSALSATGGVGTFHFTAAPEQAGQVYAVSFVAGDDDGAETNTISIQVINPNAAEDVWINEIHYDNMGTDSDEGVEIAGTAGSVLTNYALVFYNGNGGTVYDTDVLTGTLDDELCGFGAAWFGHIGVQNETEGLALVKGSNVVQFISYEGVLTASGGPAAGMTSVDIGVKESNETTPAGSSLQLKGTGTVYSSFAWVAPSTHSRGTLNAGQAIECLSPAAVEIQKTVYLGHDGGASAPGVENIQGTNGAAITYVFIVANMGGRAITNTEIQDVSLGITPIALGTLATGAVHTAHVETVISGDLRNTATVTGYDPEGLPVSDEDTAEVVEIISSLDIQLTVYRGQDAGAACPGSTFLQATNDTPVTFCFVVENNGNTNVNALVISNATLGISPISIGTLPAGGSFATSVAAVVTSSLTHVATVSGTDLNGDPIGDQASATVEIIHPALLLQKTVYLGHDGGASCPGSDRVAGTNGAPITYCFRISNDGDAALTNVALTDASLSGFSVTNLGPLATGETWTAHFETVLVGDLHNVATAAGYGPDGGLVADEDAADVEEFSASLAIHKTVYLGHDGGASCPGGDFLQATNGMPVTYCFLVENTGTTNLSSVVISDSTLDIIPIVIGTLAAGSTFATSVTTFVAGTLTNVATVAGTNPNGAPVSDQDSATVEMIRPSLSLQKTVYLGHDGGTSCPGGELVTGTNGAPITYCFRISNDGDAALTNIVLNDASLTGFSVTNLGPLATGETWTAQFETTIAGDFHNVAAASGYGPDGGIVADEDAADVAEFIASIDLQKTVYRGHDGGASCPGGDFLQAPNDTPVTYCFVVENTGTTNLTSVVISDSTLGIAPIIIGTLAAGARFTTSATAFVAGTLTNVATVAGTDPNGAPVSDQDSATVEMIRPSLSLQKTVYLGHDGGTSCPGGELVTGTNGAPITYCFRISNDGDAALTNVVLNDASLSGFSVTNLGPLATGETWTAHFETTIVGDLHNVAAASGYGPDGGLVADEDTADVAEFIPSIDIQKTVYRGHDGGASCPGGDFLQATNGTPVTYCFDVENTGTTNLTAVEISDAALGIAPIPIGTLASGATFATSVTAFVTGTLTNIATVGGTDPNNTPVGDQDSAVVEMIRPSLLLQKTVYLGHDGGASCPGSEKVAGTKGTAITFCFNVFNDGDTTLTNVVLSDAGLPGFPAAHLGTLTAGNSASLFFESILLQSRVNSATATAFTVIGTLIKDADTATVELSAPTNILDDAEFTVIDLGTLGGDASEALGINNLGEAVGWAQDAQGRTQAFRWHNGTMTGLGFLPGGSHSVATAINNRGEISGAGHVSSADYHAFLYVSNGLVDLGTLGGATSSGEDINDLGDVIGWSDSTNNPSIWSETFWWRSNEMVGIPPFEFFLRSCEGWGINQEGRICGTTFLYSSAPRNWGYVWHDDNGNGADDFGEMKQLGALAPQGSAGENSGAYDINDMGQVVGTTGITNTFWPMHAFLVTPSNGLWKIPTGKTTPTNILMQDLGTLDGPTQISAANALNNQTWIVGMSTTGSGTNQAFLWRYGTIQNLNGLIASNSGWVLTNAADINENNEIVGSGIYQGQKRAYMLRQEGRITAVDPIIQTNFWVYTNDLAEVVTQTIESVETQVLRWAGIWGGNANVPHVFTVEYCDALQTHNWTPFPPTSQWPIAETYWTNTDFRAAAKRFFRVRAQ
jgi:probable HAF family extracellular repeat protein